VDEFDRISGPDAEFHVWDSDMGITAKQREAVFEEFFQIGQTPAASHESHGLGPGLGLSIVKCSALLLHAPLDLHPPRERLNVQQPLAALRAATPHPPGQETSFPQSGTRLGVLVIDDD
jgi:two-component system, sensor histidine kinase